MTKPKKVLLFSPAKPSFRELFANFKLAQAAAILLQNGYEPRISVPTIEGLKHLGNWKEFAQSQLEHEIADFKPDVVVISTWMNQFSNSLELADLVKNGYGLTPIFLGEQVDVFPKVFKPYLQDDKGHGSLAVAVKKLGISLPQVLGALEHKEVWKNIPDLVYVADGELIQTPPYFIKNLDNLPFPLYDPEFYPAMSGDQIIKFITMLSQEGCLWNRCGYCRREYTSGYYREKSVERQIEERKYYLDQDLWMLRTNESTSHPRINQLAKRLIEEGLNELQLYSIFVNVMYSVPNNTGEVYDFDLLRKSGCAGLMPGAESGLQEELDLVGKGITVAEIEETIRRAKASGIKVVPSFIYFGTMEDAKATREIILSTTPDGISCTPLTPMPDTDTTDNPGKYRLTLERNWEKGAAFFELDLTGIKKGELPYLLDGKPFSQVMREMMMSIIAPVEQAGITAFVSEEYGTLAEANRVTITSIKQAENSLRNDGYESARLIVPALNAGRLYSI